VEIIINDERIDFTLENERTLGEVLEALESWLGRSNFVVTSVQMDDRELSETSRNQLVDTPFDEIKTLRVSAELVREVQASSVETLLEYFGLFASALESNDERNLQPLLAGRRDMVVTLNTLLRPSPDGVLARNITELNQLLTGSSAEAALAWPEGVRSRFFELVGSVRERLKLRLQEISNPMKAFADARMDMDRMREELGRVSVLLQTNEEKRAMETIVEFTDLSNRLLRILSDLGDSGKVEIDRYRIGDQDVRMFFDGLNGVLRELIEAFQIEDFVLIGDLVEYEIVPRLEMFSGFTREIESGTD